MEVSTVGDNTVKANKSLKSEKVPLEKDIKLFFEKSQKSINDLTENLKKNKTVTHYLLLTQSLLIFLTLFSGQRPSEVTHCTLDNYATLESDSHDNKLSVFKVVAMKNNVRVPVLVPDFAKEAISSLLETRSTFNVQGNLLFSKPDGSVHDTCHLISKFKSAMKLEKPEDFSANGMRHYYATMTQPYDKVKKHMPKFLGHTTLTHEKYYEMPLTEINLNVIGPFLQNKCLPSTSGRSTPPKLRKRFLDTTTSTLPEIDSDDPPDDSDKDPDFVETDKTPAKRLKFVRKMETNMGSGSSSSESESSPIPAKKRLNWITPEKDELFHGLTDTVLGKQRVKRGQVESFYKNSKFIKKRHSLQTLRIEVSKFFRGIKKVPTPTRKKLNLP